MSLLERRGIHQRLYKKYEKIDCVEFDYFFNDLFVKNINKTYTFDLINNWTCNFFK